MSEKLFFWAWIPKLLTLCIVFLKYLQSIKSFRLESSVRKVLSIEPATLELPKFFSLPLVKRADIVEKILIAVQNWSVALRKDWNSLFCQFKALSPETSFLQRKVELLLRQVQSWENSAFQLQLPPSLSFSLSLSLSLSLFLSLCRKPDGDNREMEQKKCKLQCLITT